MVRDYRYMCGQNGRDKGGEMKPTWDDNLAEGISLVVFIAGFSYPLLGILCITLCHLGYPVTSWLVLVTMAALAFGDEHV